MKYVSQRDMRKYVDLKKSCLSDSEKKQVMDIFYKYTDALILRDEIGMCPKIQVEINVIDKSIFLLGCITLRRKIKIYLIKKCKDYVT